MMFLSLTFTVLLLAGIATAAVLLIRGVRTRTSAPTSAATVRPAPPWDQALREWVAAGLIAPDQRDAILARAQAQPATQPTAPTRAPVEPRTRSIVAEALGYLGGMLALGGLTLLVGRSWSDLTTAGRAGLSGAAALLLLAAGLPLRDAIDARLLRLRSVLWLAGGGAAAVLSVVLVHDAAGVGLPRTSVLAGAGAMTLLNGALWRWRPDPLQQLTAAAAAIVAAGGAAAHLGNAVGAGGLGVLAASLVLLALSLRKVLAWPAATEVVAAAGAVVGATMVASQWQGTGLPLLLAVSASMLAITVVPGVLVHRDERTVLAVVGSIGLLQGIPGTLGHFTPGAPAVTGVTTYLLGTALTVAGLRERGRAPELLLIVGIAAMFGGAALTFGDWHGLAPLLGILTATAVLALGNRPQGLVLSVLAALGLLVNVPWLVSWYFPGQGRAPAIVVVMGLVIVGVAAWLSRSGAPARRGIGRPRHP